MRDNQRVVNITSLPQSSLGKKLNLVSYHAVYNADVSVILWVGNEDMKNNLSDLLTNILRRQ